MLTLCIPKKITDYIDTENSLTQDFILNNAIFNFNISIQPSILTTLNWKKERKKERKQLLHMSLLKIKVRSYLFIWGSAKKNKKQKNNLYSLFSSYQMFLSLLCVFWFYLLPIKICQAALLKDYKVNTP